DIRIEERDTAPAAKVYSLTAAGVDALEDWAASPYEPAERPMDPDFTQRLSFAGQLGPEDALRIVRTELDYRRRQRAQEQDTALPPPPARPGAAPRPRARRLPPPPADRPRLADPHRPARPRPWLAEPLAVHRLARNHRAQPDTRVLPSRPAHLTPSTPRGGLPRSATSPAVNRVTP